MGSCFMFSNSKPANSYYIVVSLKILNLISRSQIPDLAKLDEVQHGGTGNGNDFKLESLGCDA